MLELACPPAARGVRELEGPEEVVRLHNMLFTSCGRQINTITYLLEVGASGEDLVDEILD